MRTEKQKLATKRNWNYYKLLGSYRFDKEALTFRERTWVILIEKAVEKLKENWKNGSEELGLKTAPFYCIARKDGQEMFNSKNELITDNRYLVKLYKADKDYTITKLDE